jgi:hypothetical protein
MPASSSELPTESIEPLIFMICGRRIILDTDLARLYGVPTFRLNEAGKRNSERFPVDFRFQLTRENTAILISQSAISSGAHGGRRKLPWAFTEHGALMAANVLNSPRAYPSISFPPGPGAGRRFPANDFAYRLASG